MGFIVTIHMCFLIANLSVQETQCDRAWNDFFIHYLVIWLYHRNGIQWWTMGFRTINIGVI